MLAAGFALPPKNVIINMLAITARPAKLVARMVGVSWEVGIRLRHCQAKAISPNLFTGSGAGKVACGD